MRERRLARGIELELGWIDDHVGAGELAELLQLLRRPRSLRRPAPADHDDVADPRAPDRLDRRIGGIRGRKLFEGQCEHAGDVERDVPVPDHDSAVDVEIELEVLKVGMAVVPGDELGRRPRSRQVLSRDAEPAIRLRAEGVDDRVVEPRQVARRQIAADLDVAEEAEAGLQGDPLEGPGDGLQLRMVGSHAEPYEAPRRW